MESEVQAVPGLTVVVPAFNEEESLASAISEIRSNVAALSIPFEIVIVNDGSSDRTGAIADELSRADPAIRAIHHPKNRRVGAALKTGAAHARHRWMVLNPVDNPIPTTELQDMLAASKDVAIVVGYRSERAGYRPWMRFASRVYHDMLSVLFGLRLKDFNWCCLYQTEVLRATPMQNEGILGFPEVLIRAHHAGHALAEVPLSMRARVTGRPTVSKVRVLANTVVDVFALAWDVRVRGGGRTQSLRSPELNWKRPL
jgi:glycosyltransferase involved in cell wall biosynthesis